MIGNEVSELQLRRWICWLGLGIAGAVVGTAKVLGTEEAGALVFPTCLLLAGCVLAGQAWLLCWEAERIAASNRRPVGFGARDKTSRVRSFCYRGRLEVVTRLGYDAEILAVLVLSAGIFAALGVLARSL